MTDTTSASDELGPAPGNEKTERQIERGREDSRFIPVVLKRSDQSVRHPDDVLRNAIQEGTEQAGRPLASLFLSAISAGAILGFAAMAVGVMATLFGAEGPVPQRILLAIVYPLGFVLCLISGTQLFTEHTALAVYPVLDRRRSVTSLFRVWGTVLVGNLVGCALGAGLIAMADGVIGAAEGYASVAEHMMHYTATETLMSAVLAGWLMALGGWLILATLPDFSQIAVIYVTTFLIGLGGLHHSIAGTSEILVAAFTGAPVTAGGAITTIATAVLGNLIGGSLFVGVLNYGHIRETQLVREDDGDSSRDG
ncbi:formate/nitrite transporter family protein [Saltatorellus ferox]|uniref:formate/nitrite transporter family protein n=1 Tax=Saltatorellus ferox TaxID=2528018 RepID=UPI003AF3B63C